MKPRILFACLAAAVAQTALAADDPAAAFQRMFDHTPYYGRTVVAIDLDERDVLDTMVYAALGRDVLASLAQAPSPPRSEPDSTAARASGQTAGSI